MSVWCVCLQWGFQRSALLPAAAKSDSLWSKSLILPLLSAHHLVQLRLSFGVWDCLISRHAETTMLNGPPNGFRTANQRAECVDNDHLVEPTFNTGVFWVWEIHWFVTMKVKASR